MNGVNWSNEPRMNTTRHTIRDWIYARMCPSLALASSFLEKSRPFLARIAFANLREGTPGEQDKNNPLLDPDYEPATKDLAEVDDILLRLSEVLRFLQGGTAKTGCLSRARCTSLAEHFVSATSGV